MGDPEGLDPEDDFRRGFGRTQPVDDIESEGALLEWLCFRLLAGKDFLVFRLWWTEWLRCADWASGVRARDDKDRRMESCSKVLMASIRDALDRFIRAV